MSKDPIIGLRELAARQGEIATFERDGKRVYLVSEPEYVHQVLTHRAFSKRQGKEQATCLLGNGLMTSEGSFNQRQRKLLRPLFAKRWEKQWVDIVEDEVERLIVDWQPGRQLNTLAEFGKLSLAVACRSLLGGRFPEESQLLKALEEALDSGGTVSTLKAVRAGLDPLCDRLLARGKGPLIELLLATPLEADLRRDEIVTIVMGAHETTASAIAWSLRLLALNPGELPDRAVVAEALRLYPPGWIISREVDRTVALGPHRLEEGATVVMSPMVTHYLSEVWPQPYRFQPERFRSRVPPRGSYFPFGGGDRICIGERLAWVVSETALQAIARSWRLEPLDPGPVKLRYLAALRPACGLPAVIRASSR
jgi:cytochrome P450